MKKPGKVRGMLKECQETEKREKSERTWGGKCIGYSCFFLLLAVGAGGKAHCVWIKCRRKCREYGGATEYTKM